LGFTRKSGDHCQQVIAPEEVRGASGLGMTSVDANLSAGQVSILTILAQKNSARFLS
jgi:hypothetical protein